MRLKKNVWRKKTRRHVSGLRLAQHEPSCHWCRWQHAQIENSVSQAVPTAAGRFCALAAGRFRTASDLLGFCGMYVFSFKVQGYHMKSHVFAVQKSKKPLELWKTAFHEFWQLWAPAAFEVRTVATSAKIMRPGRALYQPTLQNEFKRFKYVLYIVCLCVFFLRFYVLAEIYCLLAHYISCLSFPVCQSRPCQRHPSEIVT